MSFPDERPRVHVVCEDHARAEKDIVLDAAMALREELLKSDRYDVALTRSNDVFIELEDRVTKARNLGADLFIALHADAGSKPATRRAGGSVLSRSCGMTPTITRSRSPTAIRMSGFAATLIRL